MTRMEQALAIDLIRSVEALTGEVRRIANLLDEVVAPGNEYTDGHIRTKPIKELD